MQPFRTALKSIPKDTQIAYGDTLVGPETYNLWPGLFTDSLGTVSTGMLDRGTVATALFAWLVILHIRCLHIEVDCSSPCLPDSHIVTREVQAGLSLRPG